MNDKKNAQTYANIAKAVKKSGKSTFGFEVPDKLISDIKEFFAVRENNLADRLKDASHQQNSAVTSTAAGVQKNQAEALNDLDKGLGRTAGGLWNSLTEPPGSKRFSIGTRDVKSGLYQAATGYFKLMIQTPIDAGLMFIGGETDARQTLFGIENIGRSLNLIERRILVDVFGASIILDVIKIKQGYAGLYNVGKDNGWTLSNNQRAITRGNTIYMKNKTPGSTDWKSTLVHEATHVWQNQNGGTDYMSEALHAQIFGDGYDYQSAISQGKSWAMLNPEQQGQLIQDAYDNSFFVNQVWLNSITYNGVTISSQAMTVFMKNVLTQLRSGQGAT